MYIVQASELPLLTAFDDWEEMWAAHEYETDILVICDGCKEQLAPNQPHIRYVTTVDSSLVTMHECFSCFDVMKEWHERQYGEEVEIYPLGGTV